MQATDLGKSLGILVYAKFVELSYCVVTKNENVRVAYMLKNLRYIYS